MTESIPGVPPGREKWRCKGEGVRTKGFKENEERKGIRKSAKGMTMILSSERRR